MRLATRPGRRGHGARHPQRRPAPPDPAGTTAPSTSPCPGVAGVYDVTIAAGDVADRRGAHDPRHERHRAAGPALDDADLRGALRRLRVAVRRARLDILVARRRHPGRRTCARPAAGTLVVAGDGIPGAPDDSYDIRLTGQPGAPVTVALVSDGQTDVVAERPRDATRRSAARSRSASSAAASRSPAAARATRSPAPATRRSETSRDEGFAPGQRIRLVNNGVDLGEFTITGITNGGLSLTLTATTAPAATGTLTQATVSRLVTRGLFTGGGRLRRGHRHAAPHRRAELARRRLPRGSAHQDRLRRRRSTRSSSSAAAAPACSMSSRSPRRPSRPRTLDAQRSP